MNKVIKHLFLILFIACAFLLTGCTNENDAKLDEVETWVKSKIPSIVYDDIELPKAYEGALIQWSSTDPELIDEEGIVTNPVSDDSVILDYKITFDDKIRKGSIEVEVSSLSIYEVEKQFINSIPGIIYETRKVKDEFKGYIITWESSKPEVYNNKGEYTKDFLDSEIMISYTISNPNHTLEGSFSRKVRGYLYSEKVDYITNSVIVEALAKLENGEVDNLPTTDPVFGSEISWDSDVDIFGKDGKVKSFPYNKKATITATITLDGYDCEEDYYMYIKANETSDLEDFLDTLAKPVVNQLKFEHTVVVSGTAYHYDVDRSYNYLQFYTNMDYSEYVTVQLAPLSYNSHKLSEGDVKFITVHDSAMVQAHQNAKLLADILSKGQETSWHFSVGDTGAYQSLPFDQVAYHAGDGTAYDATLYDTGVKATTKYPVITIGQDGYFYFNGTKSIIVAPTNDGKILKTSDIVDSGLYSEIGKNGNYYITKVWYSSDYRKISNHGGNMSSIGIESCVNAGSDYRKTIAYLSKLVGYLCIKYNLTTDNVMQHNNFSGKECPRAIRYAGFWSEFLDLVNMEIIGQTKYKDYTFTWTSLTPELLASDGKISLEAKAGDEVSYKVVVKDANSNVVIEKTYTTKLA